MRRILDTIYLASGWLAALCIGLICALVVAQVGLNSLDRISSLITGRAIGLTIPSYADFTGFFLAAASFLALAYTLRQGGHIRVTLLVSHLPRRVALVFEWFCLLTAAAIACYFSYYTLLLCLESYRYQDLSPGMIAVPLWIPQSAMLAGLIIVSIALIDELIWVIRGNRPHYWDESRTDHTSGEDNV